MRHVRRAVKPERLVEVVDKAPEPGLQQEGTIVMEGDRTIGVLVAVELGRGGYAAGGGADMGWMRWISTSRRIDSLV